MAYSSITKPTDYFNTVIYSGSNSNQSITGVGFQPDWVWIKNRSSTPSHMLNDAVRGAGKQINSDSSNAELDRTYFQSFDSDGFSLEGNVSDYNQNSSNFVSWNWLASNTTASNTDGSITSTVSANTTAGFSIVSYTGNGTTNATVGHGLGLAPKMIITKNRSNATATNWSVYHASLSTNNQITLNQTDGQNLPSPLMVTTVGASTYTLGSSRREINQSSDTYIAYCFAEKKGYSKFGSYTGNGNADGTFVHTGFKPAFLLWKKSSGSGTNWVIFDNKRDTHNKVDNYLIPNLALAEGNSDDCDFLSNGFKWRSTGGGSNGSSDTFIYMAFAENPFVGNDSGTAVPVVAR